MLRLAPPILLLHALAGTVPFAGIEEAAALTPMKLLRRIVKTEVSFETRCISFDPVRPLLAGPPTVADVALPIDAVNGLRGVRIAGVPRARRIILAFEQAHHVS